MEFIVRDSISNSNDAYDINIILRLSKSHWDYSEEFIDKFMIKNSFSESYVYRNKVQLFYCDKNLIGFFHFVKNPLINPDELLLELDSFFLHPDYIGKGFGRIMWEKCCDKAKDFKRNSFIIWADPHAEGFYLRMGCEKIGFKESVFKEEGSPSILRYNL